MGITAILEALSLCSEKERILAKKHIDNLALREEENFYYLFTICNCIYRKTL